MSTNRNIDRICCAVMTLVLVVTVLLTAAGGTGIQTVSAAEYESALFDTSRVHTIEIEMEDWDGFLENCTDEEYQECDVTVDGEKYVSVGIRAKGNTSLSSVAQYGNDRYSFKIEFDHYDSGITYHGLDKISLNNLIQDNTCMKDYVVYQIMNDFGADAPLCSFVYITVNGEDWGLYLAVEAVEESFLERNYGSDYGELYKPDSMDMGGGRGNGREFDQSQITEASEDAAAAGENSGNAPERDSSGIPPESGSGIPEDGGQHGRGGGGAGFGSDDVSLIYTDDEYDSYSNIFDNAKTEISDTDKDRLIESLKKLNAGEDIEEVVNVEEVIRYFVVHNFVCNFDSYTGSMIHNYYLYEEDGQLSMIPWDYNLAFGGFSAGGFGGGDFSRGPSGESGQESGDTSANADMSSGTDTALDSDEADILVNYPIDTPVSGGDVESRPMLAWIFSSEEYTQLYHEYFSQFIQQYFDSGYFDEMIDSVSEMIAPYVEKDPTAFCTYEEFQTGVETLKEFCSLRVESIRGQLDGTIPSDSQGQQEDSSSLIDASDLAISDMGSMGNMGGMRDDTGSDKVPGNAPEEMNFSDFGGSGVPSPPDAEASERRGIPADRSSSAEQSSADSG